MKERAIYARTRLLTDGKWRFRRFCVDCRAWARWVLRSHSKPSTTASGRIVYYNTLPGRLDECTDKIIGASFRSDEC